MSLYLKILLPVCTWGNLVRALLLMCLIAYSHTFLPTVLWKHLWLVFIFFHACSIERSKRVIWAWCFLGDKFLFNRCTTFQIFNFLLIQFCYIVSATNFSICLSCRIYFKIICFPFIFLVSVECLIMFLFHAWHC